MLEKYPQPGLWEDRSAEMLVLREQIVEHPGDRIKMLEQW